MSVLSFGELLIDFVALEMGLTVGDASGFVKAPGGAPANVAAAVARLGVPSAFMGQVGDDPFGRHLAAVLAAENVDISGLTYSSEARTALAFVSNTADGDRSFMFYRHPSADMLMTPADVHTAVIDSYDVFHHGSITFIREPAASACAWRLNMRAPPVNSSPTIPTCACRSGTAPKPPRTACSPGSIPPTCLKSATKN